MPKLSQLQSTLLTTAAERESNSLLPTPDMIKTPPVAISRSLAALVEKGLAEERETKEAMEVRRADGNVRYGLFATTAGLAAVGIAQLDEGGTTSFPAPSSPNPEHQTKSAAIIVLLSRESGATLFELIAATSWLPHTTRAALTGLRKKGHVIERAKRGNETCYRIVDAS